MITEIVVEKYLEFLTTRIFAQHKYSMKQKTKKKNREKEVRKAKLLHKHI